WGRIKADAVVAARPQRAGIGVTGLVHRTSNPLLRPRRERPRRRAAEQRDELATPHGFSWVKGPNATTQHTKTSWATASPTRGYQAHFRRARIARPITQSLSLSDRKLSSSVKWVMRWR